MTQSSLVFFIKDSVDGTDTCPLNARCVPKYLWLIISVSMGNVLFKSGMGRVSLRTSSEIFRMKGQYTF